MKRSNICSLTRSNTSRARQVRLVKKPAMPKAKPLLSTVASALKAPAKDQPVQFSRVTAQEPKTLNKSFSYENDQLITTANAYLMKGTVEKVEVNDLLDFQNLLETASANVAFTYGVTDSPSATIVASRLKNDADDNTITRTRNHFKYPQEPGVLMLDYDPPPHGKPFSPRRLISKLRRVVPALADAAMLWRASSSSGIILPDGTTTGLKGQRLYILVKDASLIPKAAKALEYLLWAAGLGWIYISKSGIPLRRCPIDQAVYRPEHLDFVANPTLGSGVKREVPDSFIDGDHYTRFDLQSVIDAATLDVVNRAKANYDKRKAEKQDEIQRIRAAWVEAQVPRLAERAKLSQHQARQVLTAAVEGQILGPDFILKTDQGEEVSVGEILSNPTQWDRRHFHDPLEPDYRQDNRIAFLRTNVKRPNLFSHAHGGQRYFLGEIKPKVMIVPGGKDRVTDQCVAVLISTGYYFLLGQGGPLIRIKNGRSQQVSTEMLADDLDRLIEFVRERSRSQSEALERNHVTIDAPNWICSRLQSICRTRAEFPVLQAAINAPTLRPDGSLLSTPGYDRETQLFLIAEASHKWSIPVDPGLDEAKAALKQLWRYFRLFPWVGPIDRGVALAALLTACLRPMLPTAPGFGFDAPTAGSGKTSVGMATGALANGEAPAAIPPVPPHDEETRKRLFALLMEAMRVILLDNLIEPLGNGALNTFLTAPLYSDRTLGSSKVLKLPNRALFLITGNNLRIIGDTYRRILVARMDAKMEHPDRRTFEFDPVERVLACRQELVAAALTIIRAWITAGRPRLGPGRTASFELWDDLVRQPVCWVSSWSKLPSGKPRFADPIKSLQRNLDQDPETQQLRALLTTWDACFNAQPGQDRQTVNDLIRFVSSQKEAPRNSPAGQLHAALVEIAGEPNGVINSRRLGRWLERHADRPINGLRLVPRGTLHRANCWQVVRSKDQPSVKA